TTKTGETRLVDLTSRAAEALNRLQAKAEAEALIGGSEPAPWIFASQVGTPRHESRGRKAFVDVRKKANLPQASGFTICATHTLLNFWRQAHRSTTLRHSSVTANQRPRSHIMPTGCLGLRRRGWTAWRKGANPRRSAPKLG